MIDPVKAFDSSLNDVTFIAANMITRVNHIQTHIDQVTKMQAVQKTDSDQLQNHLKTLVEAGARLKKEQGLLPDVAAELVKTIWTHIELAKKAGTLDLSVKEMGDPDAVPADEDAVDVEPYSDQWVEWDNVQSYGHYTTCLETGEEFNLGTQGWCDEDSDAYESIDAFIDYHGGDTDYVMYYPHSGINDGFANITTVNNPGITSGKLRQRTNWASGQADWLTVARATGVLKPEFMFDPNVFPAETVKCNGCKITFNCHERGWLTSAGGWYCCRKCCRNYMGSDAVVAVPTFLKINVDTGTWPKKTVSTPGLPEHWIDYVLLHRPKEDVKWPKGIWT